MEQLASLLAQTQSSQQDAYLGGVEAANDGKKRLEIHLSGPDSSQLQALVQPWLATIDWPGHVQTVCWQGHREDTKVAKTKTNIK